ncbi:hypothetical protein BGC07_15430 [Piscirickettsia litoralis]|uniref:Sodium:solute symporter n=1 Tax=Piscirickettsia litoralis TaxID=1891921 RepID=A0ABX2ZYH3_9GAMM|nr:hypothetical protein BGC07_15430 [Piscirickettsia litoralis]
MDLSILVLFLLANLIIGFYSSKNINSFSEYAVWKRSFSSFAICATLSASFIGGGYIMGNASKVYHIGMIYSFGLLGFSLKEILVALFIAPRMHKYNDCHSVGDMVGKHYGRLSKVITGIFSVLICTGILGAQVSAMGALFTMFFHINELLGTLIGFGVILIYASLGGMRGVVYTDILQFFVLIIGIPLILIFGLHYIGGWEAIINTVPTAHINPLSQHNGIWILLGLMLTFIFGEILVPPYAQRLFMAKSTKQTRRATFSAGVISVPVFLIAGVIGLIAYVMNSTLDPNLAIPYVIEKAMPVGVRGVVIAGLLAVIMSSAAGFLNAAAIACTNDILPSMFEMQKISHKSSLLIARIVSFIVGIGSIVFALSIKNILDILIYAYNMWSPIILIPLLGAIFGLKVNKYHFYISAAVGLMATLIWSFNFHNIFHITSNVIGVFVSFIAFVVYHTFLKSGFVGMNLKIQ